MHDLLTVDPDIELAADHINVGLAIPVRTGVCAVRIAESDMDAGNLLVLKNIADHVMDPNISSDGKLTHPIAVFISVAVFPELLFKFLVAAGRIEQAAIFHMNG